MNNEITVFDDKQLQTIKEMYCKNLTGEEITVFMHICQRTKLDPFARQIYAVKRKDNKLNKEVMTIQTGIDGYRLVAERTGKYAPGKEPIFQYDAKGGIVSCTAFVKKMTPDLTWHEVAATAFWNEYAQCYQGKPSGFWAKMPHGQLSKCAEALALRKAFPADLSGFYTKEEMEQSKADASEDNEPENLPQAEVQMVDPFEYGQPIDGCIVQGQVNIIIERVKLCDPSYVTKLKNHMLQLTYPSYYHIPQSEYEKILNGINKNIELVNKRNEGNV